MSIIGTLRYPCPYRLKNLENAHIDLVTPTYFEGKYHIAGKYWRALNLAVEPKIAIERILADLNLSVWYGIAIRIIICE